MSMELGILIFIVVIIIFILTWKTRREYHKQPVTYFILVYFKNKPTGIMENKRLKEAGYWQQVTDKTYQLESKFKVDRVASMIIEELNLTQDDFNIRVNTDTFVPQERL